MSLSGDGVLFSLTTPSPVAFWVIHSGIRTFWSAITPTSANGVLPFGNVKTSVRRECVFVSASAVLLCTFSRLHS